MLSRRHPSPRLPGNRGALAPGCPGSLQVVGRQCRAQPHGVKIQDSNALLRVCFRERVGLGWRLIVRRWLVAIASLLLVLPLFTVVHAEPGSAEFCDYSRMNFDEFKTAEVACIVKSKVSVERSGRALVVNLDDGKKVNFLERRESCETAPVDACLHYAFIGYLPEIHAAVIRRGCYEFCLDVLLVNLADGKTIVTESTPEFAPDRRHFVIVANNDAVELRTPDVQLFAVKDRKPKLVFTHKAQKGSYFLNTTGTPVIAHVFERWNLGSWIDPDNLNLTVVARGPGCIEPEQPIRLTKFGENWRLQPEPCR
jgi:hypothetical protein